MHSATQCIFCGHAAERELLAESRWGVYEGKRDPGHPVKASMEVAAWQMIGAQAVLLNPGIEQALNHSLILAQTMPQQC